MPRSQQSKQLVELRQLALAGDATGFVARLLPLLQGDFPRWFRELKLQKLVSQFRSSSLNKDIRRLLLNSGGSSPFSENETDALAHHFDVCDFFQHLFDFIDTETAALSCRAAHPEVFARTVIRVLEVSNYGFQRNVTAGAISEGKMTALEVSQRARQFRDLMDAGNIILGSRIARTGEDKAYKISDVEINRLVELAFQYDEVRQIFDVYTYQDANFRINRRSLIVKGTGQEAARASAVGAERTSSNDQTRHAMLSLMEVEVQQECSKVQVESSLSFLAFLSRLSNDTQRRAREYLHAFKTDLEFEVGSFFDLNSSVKTNSGNFTVSELISAWAFIGTVAMLGQRWSERLAVVTEDDTLGTEQNPQARRTLRDMPTPELGRRWLVRMLAREVNTTRLQATNLVDQFSSHPATGRIDLFYKPLMHISDVVLFPTAYIRSSRFDRNIFMLIATESDLDQKKKGYLPVRNLREDFIEAGFQSLTDFRVRVNGQEITDVDLIAFKDGLLFLAQSKIVIDPDSGYDIWKAEEKLTWAAVQLGKCLEHLDAFRDDLFERLGIRGAHEQRVVPFIITNSRQFTERRFGGYPVVDVPYVHFILGGARGAVIGTGSGRIGTAPGKGYIKGKYPTAAELEELLNRTIHKVMERMLVERFEMKKIGDRKIHVPMVGLKTAGEDRMVITDKEIFGEDTRVYPWEKHG